MQERCKICSDDHPCSWDFKRTFLAGPSSCGATIAILHRNQFPCFLKGRWIAFGGKPFKPTKSLVTFLSLHEYCSTFSKTFFTFSLCLTFLFPELEDLSVSDLLGVLTCRDRFQYSILSSFILICSSHHNLWHKGESDLKYKAACQECNVTFKNIVNNW